MKLILFGATGMVGAGVLREALAAPDVTEILSIGRRASGVSDPRLRELLLDRFILEPADINRVGA